MNDAIYAAEQVSLFCRLNLHSKRELPIRSSEMGMLIYLCHTDEEKTPMGVARYFRVSKAMVTNMVSSLVKKGYLEKKPSPEDGRSWLLIPTEKAKDLVERTYREYYKNPTSANGSRRFQLISDADETGKPDSIGGKRQWVNS